jgi:glutathione synthase/RimK-type ligase-like ATP-grasp enzyme
MKYCPEYLIVTNKTDLTSDYIVREMRARNLKFSRINTEASPELCVVQKLGEGGTVLNSGKVQIDLAKIRGAYFRRPLHPKVENDKLTTSSIHYIREEWSYLLRSIYLELDKKWFSHPNKIILAEDKPMQLRLADELGFLVPETVITNKLEAVQELFNKGDVVAKPLKQALLDDEGSVSSVIFTSAIQSITQIDCEALRLAPVIFQRKLKKKFDLRITVVERDVFSVAIKSQEFEKTQTDWRHGSIVDLEHEVFELPEDIAKRCIKIVQRLGLRFGAIDLVLDEAGQFWFLECNPNGQWAWIENRTGLPIAASIVSAMESITP